MSFIFGGGHSQQQSQSTQTSYNQAYPQIDSAFSPILQYGSQASTGIANLLGLGGDPSEQQKAFDKYRQNTGYQFAFDQGNRAVQQAAAGTGALNSGATLKALDKYGQGVADQSFGSYLQNLTGLGNQALVAGANIGDTGQYSYGQSTGQSSSVQNSGNAGKAIGTALSLALLSDRRTKKNIRHLFSLDNGLPVYEFEYKHSTDKHIGVMADEVEQLIPEALGPTINGFKTVIYSKIWE